MLVEDIPYSYNNKEYVLWMWKGDYWNLGTGSEIGLYQQSAESRTHYDAVDFLCSMQLSTYKAVVDHCVRLETSEAGTEKTGHAWKG